MINVSHEIKHISMTWWIYKSSVPQTDGTADKCSSQQNSSEWEGIIATEDTISQTAQ